MAIGELLHDRKVSSQCKCSLNFILKIVAMPIKRSDPVAALVATVFFCTASNATEPAPAASPWVSGSPALPAMAPPFLMPTPCAGDIPPDTFAGDPDVSIRSDATLNVMFHGNRFVAAPELVAKFERLNPSERVSWTALPPANTRRVISSGPQSFAGSKPFYPDVVMMPALSQATQTGKKLINRGLYSNLHGIVLIARAGDQNVSGTDFRAIVNNPKVKMVLAGQQALDFPLIVVSGVNFGAPPTDGTPRISNYGVSQQRHHRSVPARILAECEDVGFEYLQSQPYLQERFPGKFKFVSVAMSAQDAASEASYLYLVPEAVNADSAVNFVSFMKSGDALEILRKYHLEP